MFALLYVQAGWEAISNAMAHRLNEDFKKLAISNSKSLLKIHLTEEIFNDIKNKRSSYGSTLLDCIQSGLQNLDSTVGIYAPDPSAYKVFAEIFDPIIEDYHKGFTKDDVHPPCDFGNPADFGNLDPKGDLVISTRIRIGRSIKGYPFNPCMDQMDYLSIEENAKNTLATLTGDLKGSFYPLTQMAEDVKTRLIEDHFLFKEGDRFLHAAKACRFWPEGRAIFHNDEKTFLVWVNEEDHLRIISMQKGGDVGQVYERLIRGIGEIGKHLTFEYDKRLGFLTFCPTNLGTTLRASVLIRIPKLLRRKSQLDKKNSY